MEGKKTYRKGIPAVVILDTYVNNRPRGEKIGGGDDVKNVDNDGNKTNR